MKRSEIRSVLKLDLPEDLNSVKLDSQIKTILRNKGLSAVIIRDLCREFHNSSIQDIIKGLGETDKVKLIGLSTENNIPREGRVFFDLLFSADNVLTLVRIYVNIEVQNNTHPGYPITRRGIFHCARMLSMQANTEFSLSEQKYGQIKKVYSIWLLPDSPMRYGDSIYSYALQRSALYGTYEKEEDYDLLEVIIVRVTKSENIDDHSPAVLRLVKILFSATMESEKMINELEKLQESDMDEEEKKEVVKMYTMAQRYYDRGVEKGVEKGAEAALMRTALNMLKEGMSEEQIVRLSQLDAEKVRELARSYAESCENTDNPQNR